MGADKVRNARATGAEVLCAADNSCLMHIGGTPGAAGAGLRARAPRRDPGEHARRAQPSGPGRHEPAGAGRMSGTFLGMPSFPAAARAAAVTTRLRGNLRHATHTIRAKRAAAVAELDDWAAAAGGGDADQGPHAAPSRPLPGAVGGSGHRGRRHRCTGPPTPTRPTASSPASSRPPARARSSRSSRWPPRRSGSTRPWSREGIRAYETDLAELIVQLGDDRPSHILVPAIHRNRGEIRDIFRTRDGRLGPPGARGPHRHARRTRRGRAAAPAGEVPARQGRHLRRQLHGRRDRHARGRRVRGQRPDVPDPARDADLRRRHREGRADLAGPGGLPADCCPAPRRPSG